MANKCKKPSERKTVYLGMRITPKQKECWEYLAKIKGVSSSQMLKKMFESFLERPDWKKYNTWAFIKAAAQIIDKDEQDVRKRRRRMVRKVKNQFVMSQERGGMKNSRRI